MFKIKFQFQSLFILKFVHVQSISSSHFPILDDYENSAVFSQHPLHQSRLLLSATDPQRSHQELQHYPMAGAIVRQNGEDCSSSVSSSLSVTSDWDRDHQGLEHQGYSWHHKMHLRDPIRTCGMAAGPQARTRTLEFFGGRPPEPTFSQERSNLHAVEVSGII